MRRTLGFAILWTIFATIGTVGIWHDPSWATEAPKVRYMLSALPVAGVFFIWWSWRRFRRYNSVRLEDTACGVQFVWVDLDGRPRVSATDPRLQWDDDDRLDEK